MATKNRPKLSEMQLELMNIIWEKGKATVTEVWEALPPERKLARTTVMTVLSRLSDYGWLEREKSGNEFIYIPAEKKDKVLGRLVSRLVETAFAGSTKDMIMTLVSERGISNEEAEHLRKIIAEAEKNSHKED